MVIISWVAAGLALASSSSVATGSALLRSKSNPNNNERKLDVELFTETCTGLVGIGVDYDLDVGENNQTWLACVTPSGMIHDFPEVCKQWVENVGIKGELKSSLTLINVAGAVLNSETGMLDLPQFPPEFMDTPPRPENKMHRSKGDRKLVAVRVITTDGTPSTTEEKLRESLFGAQDSLTAQMSGCSQAKMNIIPANKIAPGFNDGVITIEVPFANAASENLIRNAVTRKIVEIFGVSHPENLGDFFLYCLPDGAMTREMYSFVDGWLSVYSDRYCTNVAAQMRGIGHNIGFGPSRVWRTWEPDMTGMMGDNTFLHPKKCFNPAKMSQAGWYDPEKHAFRKYSPPVTFDLVGFVQTPEVPGRMKLVQFERNVPVDLYMYFNWASGPNANADKEYANKVIITQMGYYGVRFDVSYVFAKLGVGETYYRALYYDHGFDVNVTVNSIDIENGFANVSYTAYIPGVPTMSPTVGPTAPTDAPTDSPTFMPIPPCYELNEFCEGVEDCCDGGTGVCLKVIQNEGFNVRMVCQPAGTVFDPNVNYGPTGPPGRCNDNGRCDHDENCFSCPSDCNGLLSGPKDLRYCCDGSGQAPYTTKINDDKCDC